MSLGTSNRDGGKTSESGHLRALGKVVKGDIITGFNAVQRNAGVNMSVDIQVGDAFVRRSDGSYAHPVFNDAVYNQVITTADGSNPRRDIVVLYVDYGVTPSTAVSNNTNGVVKIKVVNGTAAGSPIDPTDSAIQASVGAGNPWTKIARVRVPAGQASISNTLIDDLRVIISPLDGTVSNAALAEMAVQSKNIDWTKILYKSGVLNSSAPVLVAGTATTVLTVPAWVKAGTKIGIIADLTTNTGGTQSDFWLKMLKNGVAFFNPSNGPNHQQAGAAWVSSFAVRSETTVNPGDVIVITYGRGSANGASYWDSWYEIKEIPPNA